MQIEIPENLDVAIAHINEGKRSAILLYLLCKSITESSIKPRLVVSSGSSPDVEDSRIYNINRIVDWHKKKFSDLDIDIRFYRFVQPNKEVKNDLEKYRQYHINTSETFFEEALTHEEDNQYIHVYSGGSVTNDSVKIRNHNIQNITPLVNLSNDEIIDLYEKENVLDLLDLTS